MEYRLGDRSLLEGRVLVVRGFDPMSVRSGRVYLEDEVNGELVTELIARLPQAGRADEADEAIE